MKESKVEREHLGKGVRAIGGFTRKFTSPGHDGVPDQIVSLPGELWFIEVKVTGEKPTKAQWREIMRFRDHGHNAGYLAGEREVKAFLASSDRKRWMKDHIE